VTGIAPGDVNWYSIIEGKTNAKSSLEKSRKPTSTKIVSRSGNPLLEMAEGGKGGI